MDKKDLNAKMAEKIKNNKGCAITYYIFIFVGFVSFILFIKMIISDFKGTALKPCEEYNLSRYAKTCEDLLITHEITGVITKRYVKYDKFYTTEVNSILYKSTTPEQRSLIICSTKEIAKQKGLKPLVTDEKGLEY